MTPNDVTEVLRQIILATTPVGEAIYEWPNAPRPSVSYATLGINLIQQVNFSDYKDSNNLSGDIDRQYSTLFDITIGVNFFRSDSMLNASLFSGGLTRQDTTDLLNQNKIGLVSRSNIRDLTTVINASFEDRAQLDIALQALITMPVEDIASINIVHITGDVHNASGVIEQIEIIGMP